MKNEKERNVKYGKYIALEISSPCTYFNAGVVGVELSASWVGQQDVLWFQVSVDNSFGLQHSHRARYLLQEHADGVLTQRALGFVCVK